MLLDIILASVFGIVVFYAHILIKKITTHEQTIISEDRKSH
jgi:hypothetical protein